MNIELFMSREEAIKLYSFMFTTSPDGIRIRPLGTTFMMDLIYPLTSQNHESTWLFSSGGVLWFLNMVREAKQSWPVCDDSIKPILRRMHNAYMAMIDKLVPDDPSDPKSPEATSRPAD